MGYFSIQTITALVEVVTGGSGLGDRRGRIGLYRTGPQLEQFLGAAGIELHIGNNSRIPSVRMVVANANENDPDAVVRLIEQVADPREYLSHPKELKAVVEYLNARLRGDSYELVQIDEAFKLRHFPPTEAVVSGAEEKVETQKSDKTEHRKANSGDSKNMPKKDIPVFPDIIPSSIKEGRLRVLEKGDFATDEDVQDLIMLLFSEPECEFYYFVEKGAQLDSLLHAAINRGDVRITETKFFYYKHPKIKRDYVHIERPHGSYQWEWEKEVVQKGPMFCRSQLELSQRKKRELEIQQIKNALPKEVGRSHVIKAEGNKDTKSELVNATKPTAPTRYERYIRRFKENKVFSIILVCAMIIIAFGMFTDALKKIRDFWFKSNLSSKQEMNVSPASNKNLGKPIVVASATVEVKITSDWDFNGRVDNIKAYLAFVKGNKPLLITSSIGYTASQTGNDEVVYKAKLDMDAKDSAVGNPASFLKDAEYIQIEFGRMPSDSYVLEGDAICIINNSVRLEFSIPSQKLVNNRIFIRNLSESLQVLNEPGN